MENEAIESNEQFWTTLWNKDLASLVPPSPGILQEKLGHYALFPAPRFQDHLLAEWYSEDLDAWAVTLELGRYSEAKTRLEGRPCN